MSLSKGAQSLNLKQRQDLVGYYVAGFLVQAEGSSAVQGRSEVKEVHAVFKAKLNLAGLTVLIHLLNGYLVLTQPVVQQFLCTHTLELNRGRIAIVVNGRNTYLAIADHNISVVAAC